MELGKGRNSEEALRFVPNLLSQASCKYLSSIVLDIFMQPGPSLQQETVVNPISKSNIGSYTSCTLWGWILEP